LGQLRLALVICWFQSSGAVEYLVIIGNGGVVNHGLEGYTM
jgi:hypothetical protein